METPLKSLPKGDPGLDLDLEVAARHKAERVRHFMTRDLIRLRITGYGLMVGMVPVHNFFMMGDPTWGSFWVLFSVATTLALLSWGVLTRYYDKSWRGLDLDPVFRALDVIPVALVVFHTGAERSFLFPLFLSQVANQTHTTFRRALFFTFFMSIAFLGTIAYAAWGAGHLVSWGLEGIKAGLLFAMGLFITITTREAERLRKKVHNSITLTRDFNLQLVAQTEELRVAKEEADQAKQQAETASRTKSAFLASTSHDLRTPLNAILLYSELLSEDAEAAGQTETVADLKKIHGAGKHLLQLLNDLLDLAKVEAGKMTFFLEAISVADLVTAIRDLAGPLVSQKKNMLVLEVDPGLQTLVADSTRLRQILLNLLSNAAKFTEEGEITLALRTETREGADWVLAEVRDTGLGMSPDQLRQLFQEFVQAEDSTTKKFGGTGLGLVLCRRLCELMGGDIQVTSTLGKGSSFTVRLPLRRTLDTAPERGKAPGLHRGRKVLIIDDDEAIREGLRRMFTQEGFDILEATHGEEGLRLAREAQPSLITLDVVMPGIDGWTVLRTLKSDPNLAGIPVILITMADDRSQGLALGAAEYLPKPIDPRRFQEVLSRLAPEAGSLLLVEDDQAQREAMGRILESAGWQVQTAIHGLDALRILEGGLIPDLILLDLRMPEMDGFEFMDVLHQREMTSQIPVVVITSEDLGQEARDRLAQRGVHQVLPKSAYPKEKLVEIVRDLALRLPGGA